MPSESSCLGGTWCQQLSGNKEDMLSGKEESENEMKGEKTPPEALSLGL